MATPNALPITRSAIITLAEITTTTEAFERGDCNMFDALDAIVVAVEAYQRAGKEGPRRYHRPRDAA